MDSDSLRAGLGASHIPRAQHRVWQEVMVQPVRSDHPQLASLALSQRGRCPPTACLVVLGLIKFLQRGSSRAYLGVSRQHGWQSQAPLSHIPFSSIICPLFFFPTPFPLLNSDYFSFPGPADPAPCFCCILRGAPTDQGSARTSAPQIKRQDTGILGRVIACVKTGFISKYSLIWETKAKRGLAWKFGRSIILHCYETTPEIYSLKQQYLLFLIWGWVHELGQGTRGWFVSYASCLGPQLENSKDDNENHLKSCLLTWLVVDAGCWQCP